MVGPGEVRHVTNVLNEGPAQAEEHVRGEPSRASAAVALGRLPSAKRETDRFPSRRRCLLAGGATLPTLDCKPRDRRSGKEGNSAPEIVDQLAGEVHSVDAWLVELLRRRRGKWG